MQLPVGVAGPDLAVFGWPPVSALRPVPGAGADASITYLFPHAGGSATDYRLLTAPSEDVGWTAVQLRGRGARFALDPLEGVDEIVADILDELVEDVDRHGRPYAFFGHSFGALLAFEATRALSAVGSRLPVDLGVSAFPAPHRIPRTPALGSLGDHQLLEYLDERFGAIPSEVLEHPELAQLVAGYIRSDYRAIEAYVAPAVAKVGVGITAFFGTEDGEHPDDVTQWSDWCGGRFRSLGLPGGHFYLHNPANAARLRSEIAAGLTRGA